MTRRHVPALPAGALALALLGAGCASSPPPPAALAAPPTATASRALPPPGLSPDTPPPAPAAAPRGRRPAPAAAVPDAPPPPPPLPFAPTAGRPYVAPPPTAAQRDQAALIAACREQAEQIIVQRDRGQLLREDEQAARVGASSSIADSRFTSDRLGRVFARDRLAEECVETNRPLPPR